MRQKAKQFIKHPLISGSAVIFSGTFLGNIFNFLFNLFVLKNLTKVDYATLQSIMALVALPGIVAIAISPLIVKFGGEYFTQKKLDNLRGLYRTVAKFFFLIGFIFFILFLFFIPQISHFFHVQNSFIFILAAIFIFINFQCAINVAFLQARLSFPFITFIVLLMSVLKLGLGVAFIFAGFAINGAVSALVLSLVIPYFITFLPLKFLSTSHSKSISLPKKELLSYGLPSALIVLGMTSLISSDLILAKRFLNPDIAGEYAGLSLIGRVIFLFTAPITMVMFPLVVRKYTNKEPLRGIFFLSLLLVLVPSVLLTVFYFLFPHFVILLFARSDYAAIAPFVGFFGIVMTMYSLVNVLVYFYLAIRKMFIIFPSLAAAFLQIILLFFFHKEIIQFVSISFGVTFLLLCTLLLYYPYATKK